MAVRIRLARHGRKKAPFYRLVVAVPRSPRDGRYIEQLGSYDSMKEPAAIKVDEDRAMHWLTVGATPSDTARSILRKAGVWEKFEAGKKKVE